MWNALIEGRIVKTYYCIAKSQGYNLQLRKGYIAMIWPHYWVEMDGGVVDPCFKNLHNASGWKIHYGQRGTYRYTRYRTICN